MVSAEFFYCKITLFAFVVNTYLGGDTLRLCKFCLCKSFYPLILASNSESYVQQLSLVHDLFLFALSIYPAFSPWPISIHPAHPNSREFLLWDAFPDCPSQMKNFFLHTSLAASSYLASQYTSPCLLFFCFCFSVSHPA